MLAENREAGLRAEWRPGRLWGLWEIVDSLEVGKLLGIVHSLALNVSLGTDDSAPLADHLRAQIIEDLEAVLSQCERLGLLVPSENARMGIDMLKKLSGFKGETGVAARMAATIVSSMRIELNARKFFALSPEKARFYESAALLGADFTSKFPSAAFETDEAGKCLSFGRATASVFHLMRVMEICIRAMARCLAIPDPLKPAERNWGFILGEIKKGIDAKWPTQTVRHGGDGELFESLYVSLDAVRNPWRNATMHVENKYTFEEAEHILVAVRGFATKLASRMDEQGLPLA